ncbi:unnamed protein product [Ascophyllum nodosum]
MNSVITYLVLVTAALALTILGYIMYSALGMAAFQAAAPFLGTLAIVFGVAHYMDKASESEDAKSRRTRVGSASKSEVLSESSGIAHKGTGSVALPKRRRVAD